MKEDNFHLIGRAIQKENPELFNLLAESINQLESKALNSVDQLPELYNTFCALIGDSVAQEKRARQTIAVILQRRLFLAIAVYLYDPLFLKAYKGRIRDRLRTNMAETLQCCPEWISNTLPSVLFEYNHINTFQMQVNIIAYYLKQGVEVQAA